MLRALSLQFRKRFSPLLNRACPPPCNDHLATGSLGEKIACAYLRSEGRRVLYRNFRGPKGGEIDIVTRDGNTLAFVEVKTRTSEQFTRPLDAVNHKKKRLMERGAKSWLQLLGTRDLRWRLDVVEIILLEGEKPRVTTVENVTG